LNVRENITLKEASCPHCGQLPSDKWLDWLQDLREACGFPLPFKSIHRCNIYNEEIGGSDESLHTQFTKWSYGAADIGIADPTKRLKIIRTAIKLGTNNLEVCDFHLHIGRAPVEHPQYNKLYWGKSK